MHRSRTSRRARFSLTSIAAGRRRAYLALGLVVSATGCTSVTSEPSIRSHHLFHPLQAPGASKPGVDEALDECVVGRSVAINAHEKPSKDSVIIDLGYPRHSSASYRGGFYVEFFELERNRPENRSLLSDLARRRHLAREVFLGRRDGDSNWHYVAAPSRCPDVPLEQK